MTPQMIRVLCLFMTGIIFKESFNFPDMKKSEKICSLLIMTTALIFTFLVYKQWQYLG